MFGRKIAAPVSGAALTAAALVLVTAVPALAYSSTPYSVTSKDNCSHASGKLTWLNRSVGVQGGITANCNGTAVVQFDAYVGAINIGHTTRSESTQGATKPYNFTLDGSAWIGGITQVCVTTWAGPYTDNLGTQCFNRP